jgi:hypothetical protein
MSVAKKHPFCKVLFVKILKIILSYIYMILPYLAGLWVGMCLGKANERAYSSYYYYHTEKIIKLENKLKEYERLFGKIN